MLLFVTFVTLPGWVGCFVWPNYWKLWESSWCGWVCLVFVVCVCVCVCVFVCVVFVGREKCERALAIRFLLLLAIGFRMVSTCFLAPGLFSSIICWRMNALRKSIENNRLSALIKTAGGTGDTRSHRKPEKRRSLIARNRKFFYITILGLVGGSGGSSKNAAIR